MSPKASPLKQGRQKAIVAITVKQEKVRDMYILTNHMEENKDLADVQASDNSLF